MTDFTPLTLNFHLIQSIKRINELYNHNTSLRGIQLNTKQNTHFFLYDVTRGMVNSVSKKHMNRFILHTPLDVKIHRSGPFTFCLFNRVPFIPESDYEPQVSVLSSIYKNVMEKITLIKGAVTEWGSHDMHAFFINLLIIVIDSFGYKTFTG